MYFIAEFFFEMTTSYSIWKYAVPFARLGIFLRLLVLLKEQLLRFAAYLVIRLATVLRLGSSFSSHNYYFSFGEPKVSIIFGEFWRLIFSSTSIIFLHLVVLFRCETDALEIKNYFNALLIIIF